MTLGGAGSAPSGGRVSESRTARRCPIVSVSGLTRSKGSVSQAGRTRTGPERAPTTSRSAASAGASRQARSSPNRWASWPVAVTTSIGARSVNAAIAATTTACAASGTATVESAAPISTAMAGSARSSRGMAARLPPAGAGGRVGRVDVMAQVGSEWHHAHGGVDPLRRDALHRVRRGLHGGGHEFAHRLGGPAEHVRRTLGGARRLADADAHPEEVLRVQV